MKIEFPKIVRVVDLSEYAPELSGQYVHVWVNPPVKLLTQLSQQFNDEKKQDEFLACLSELLSQGPEGTAFTKDELFELIEGTAERDPAFWVWLQNGIVQAISEYRTGLKKGSPPPPPS